MNVPSNFQLENEEIHENLSDVLEGKISMYYDTLIEELCSLTVRPLDSDDVIFIS